MTPDHPARQLWLRMESLHAVTYFAPESIAAAADAGLKGFWMGYFGFRAAPLGPVPPGVVEAIFANFAPGRVRRAIPDAWRFASPETLVIARRQSAGVALRRLVPAIDETARVAVPVLDEVMTQADPFGRPLFAANRDLEPASDPVERLWQLCTTAREHRGDGHVAVLAAEGISGPHAHRLLLADRGHPESLYLQSRGWDSGSWAAASDDLSRRGLVVDGKLTAEGRELRVGVEARTDELAWRPFASLPAGVVDPLMAVLDDAARSVAASGEIPDQNPIGLPVADLRPGHH